MTRNVKCARQSLWSFNKSNQPSCEKMAHLKERVAWLLSVTLLLCFVACGTADLAQVEGIAETTVYSVTNHADEGTVTSLYLQFPELLVPAAVPVPGCRYDEIFGVSFCEFEESEGLTVQAVRPIPGCRYSAKKNTHYCDFKDSEGLVIH